MDQRIVLLMQSSQPNGFEICKILVRKGFKLVLADTNTNDAQAVANMLLKYGGEVHAIDFDVNGVGRIDRLFSNIIDQFGRIDILVNNTIIDVPHPAETMPIEYYWNYLTNGLKNVFFGCQLAARRMVAQEPISNMTIPTKGIIVNITSICSVLAFPGLSAFCSSMAAINTLSRILACEWGPKGIRIDVIVPGLMDFLSRYQLNHGTNVKLVNISNPIQPQTSAKAIAEAVSSLLCRDEGSTVGAFYYIDNGYLSYGYI